MRRPRQPTRTATALRYDTAQENAPRVVAKGRGLIAENIIQTARAHGVPLVADAGMSGLLEDVEVDAQIPPEFYLAVAEILAFVYRLNAQSKPESQRRTGA